MPEKLEINVCPWCGAECVWYTYRGSVFRDYSYIRCVNEGTTCLYRTFALTGESYELGASSRNVRVHNSLPRPDDFAAGEWNIVVKDSLPESGVTVWCDWGNSSFGAGCWEGASVSYPEGRWIECFRGGAVENVPAPIRYALINLPQSEVRK